MFNALSSMNVYLVLLLVLVLVQATTSDARSSNLQCMASSCGNIHNIYNPFRLKNDPKECGDSKYELACEDDRTVMYFPDGRFYVQSINYSNYQFRLVDDGLQKDNYSSLPHQSRASYHFKIHSEPNIAFYMLYNWDGSDLDSSYSKIGEGTVVIVNCSKPVSSPLYISMSPYIEGLYSFNTSSNWKLYALLNPTASDVWEFCTINSWTWISPDFDPHEHINISSYNYERIHNIMADGFSLKFPTLPKKFFFCNFDFYKYFRLHNYFDSYRFEIYEDYRDHICGSWYYNDGKHGLAMKFCCNFA